MTETHRSRSVALYAPLGSFSLDRGPACYAPALCQSIGASLTGLLFNIEANSPAPLESRSLDAVEKEMRDHDTANAVNAARLEQICAELGVPARSITAIDHSRGIVSCVADQARLHDVLVMGSTPSGILGDRMMAENLLFQTGRPVIVVPPRHQTGFAGKRIVAAWDNSRASARALGDALALLPNLAEVVFVTIGDEKAIWSGRDDAGLTAALTLRGLSVQVQHRSLQGRTIGDALQDAAIELEADMLVMGGCGHSRLRDFFLGGATLSVLDAPRLPVLLSH
jgi:nucleotide-binding universal stress UspA family protein